MKSTAFALLPLILLASRGRSQAQEYRRGHNRYFCPPDFIHLGHSCYYFSSAMANWHSAHFACRDRGSHLAVLDTQWEDNNVRSYLNRPEFAALNRWVGGIYNWSRQQWTWGSSGRVMPYNGFITPDFPRSTRWHCVYLSPSLNYRWNHAFCTNAMHYLCETPQVIVSEPL